MLAAFDHLQALAQDFRVLLFDLGAEAGNFVLAERDDDFVDGRGGCELTQRVDKNGHAAQFFELFGWGFSFGFRGRVRGHARAQSGRRNDDKNLHRGDQYSTGSNVSQYPAPKGAVNSENFAVSLKRYPDTKLELFSDSRSTQPSRLPARPLMWAFL